MGSKYFRFIGILEIISYIIGLIIYIIFLFTTIRSLFAVNPSSAIAYIFGFIAYCILGPALGLLFLSHARLLEEKENSESKNDKSQYVNQNSNQNKSNNYQTNSNNKVENKQYSNGLNIDDAVIITEDYYDVKKDDIGTVSGINGDIILLQINNSLSSVPRRIIKLKEDK